MSKHPVPIETEELKVSWDAQPITLKNIQLGLLKVKEEWKELSIHTRNRIIRITKDISIVTGTIGIAISVGGYMETPEKGILFQASIVAPVALTYLTRELIKQKREKLPKMWRYSVDIITTTHTQAKAERKQKTIRELNQLPKSTFEKRVNP